MNISVKNVSFCYKNNITVLHDISFEISGHGITALIGPNGAGKSTMLKCLLNIEENFSGNILIENSDIKKISLFELSKLVSYVPQKNQNVLNYKVIDIVLMGFNNDTSLFSMPDKKQIEKAYDILKEMKIESLSEKIFSNLSGGEQQLVLICRSLIQNAKLILMDEPFSFLDFANQIRVKKVMRQLSEQGISIVYTTHNPNDVLQNSDYVIALKNGKLMAIGKTSDTVTEKMFSELYGVNFKIINTADGKFIKEK